MSVTPFRAKPLNRSPAPLPNCRPNLPYSQLMKDTIDKLQVLALERPKLAAWLISWFARSVDRHVA
jgi:hypothetical protein